MITSKDELKYYIQQDCIRNTGHESVGIIRIAIHLFYGNDSYRVFWYLRALRRYEYVLNCMHGLWGNICLLLAKTRWHRLGVKYNVLINPNIVGYGFRIPHLIGGGVIINCKSIGHNSTANAGVIVGNNQKGGMATIGNNVDLSIGCKVIGGVKIGNNVIVAPNSVVVKDIPDGAIVSGVPATILKYQLSCDD